jgi:DNA-binding transcriptional regulator YdaS (Cro superfamily)
MEIGAWLRAERGRTKRLAAGLAPPVSESLVTQWGSGKAVSAERCYPIERFTEGEVMRWDLRPGDWHEIWPELAARPGAPMPVERAA